mmetsp:Transcript_153966/g.493624  ORF Transcript_153966/g.493624 Transcript_153966/m.493624 type:complete len:1296 (-) Transcript_153966:324-4211(-)
MEKPLPHVVMVGPLGVGKSQLCSALAGLPANNNIFAIGDSTEAVTTTTTCHKAQWFGLSKEEEFLEIDTRGVGEGEARDPANIAALVHELRELGHVSVFVLVFNSEQPRLNATVQNMLLLLEECFGWKLWRNVALLFTRWYMDPKSQQRRKKSSDQIKQEWSSRLRELFPTSIVQALPDKQPFPCYFVDSEAAIDPGADAEEREAALKELQRFSMLARALPPFPTTAARPAESQNAAPSAPAKWSDGSSVQVMGLVSAASLNGEVGTVQSFEASAQRYVVKFSDGSMKSIKAVNLLQSCGPGPGSKPSSAKGDKPAARASPTSPSLKSGQLISGDNVQVGIEVERGPSWTWGNQDGGLGGLGRIVQVSGDPSWATVQWRAGGKNRYRIGTQGKHDLKACPGAFEMRDKEMREAASSRKSQIKAKHLNCTFGYASGARHSRFSRFDIRDEVCKAVGDFTHGQMVSRKGKLQSVVIGVKADDDEPKLWFHCEGFTGAGLFSGGEASGMKVVGRQKVREALPEEFDGDSDEDDNEALYQIGSSLQLTFGYPQGTGNFVAFAKFDIREDICMKVGGFKHGTVLVDLEDRQVVVVGVKLDDERRPALFMHVEENHGAGIFQRLRAIRHTFRIVGSRVMKECKPDDAVFLDRVPIPAEVAELARKLQLNFGYPCGAGDSVVYEEFDVRDHICMAVGGFKQGQVVRDSEGKTSVVIGVRRPRTNGDPTLWFHMDGKLGAGVFPRYHVYKHSLRVVGSREVVQFLPNDPMFRARKKGNKDPHTDMLRMLRKLVEGSDSSDSAASGESVNERDIEFDFTFQYPQGKVGTELGWFDIRDDVCMQVGGFLHGQVVEDPNGDTHVVIGVKLLKGKPHLWFHEDGHGGATIFADYKQLRHALDVVGTRDVQQSGPSESAVGSEDLKLTFRFAAGLILPRPAMFDIRDDICMKVGGFTHGQVVTTLGGDDEFVVIGVKVCMGDTMPKLWYLPRGKHGAGLQRFSDSPAIANKLLRAIGTETVQEFPMKPSGFGASNVDVGGNGEHDDVGPQDSVSQVAIATDIASAVSRASSSGASRASCVFAGGQGGHCFLPDTLFLSLSNNFVPARFLDVGASVMGANGKKLQVMGVNLIIKSEKPQRLVKLRTRDADLTVTWSHRVMVEQSGRAEAVPAKELKVGDLILCGDGTENHAQVLESVEAVELHTDVVEICFHPDEAVEAFLPPGFTILTKGRESPLGRQAHDTDSPAGVVGEIAYDGTDHQQRHYHPQQRAETHRTRRAGMWKRPSISRLGGRADVFSSIPPTETSWKD